jgi:hypothetical protein
MLRRKNSRKVRMFELTEVNKNLIAIEGNCESDNWEVSNNAPKNLSFAVQCVTIGSKSFQTQGVEMRRFAGRKSEGIFDIIGMSIIVIRRAIGQMSSQAVKYMSKSPSLGKGKLTGGENCEGSARFLVAVKSPSQIPFQMEMVARHRYSLSCCGAYLEP